MTGGEAKALLLSRLDLGGRKVTDYHSEYGAEGLRVTYPAGLHLDLWWLPRRPRYYRCDLGREDTIFRSFWQTSLNDRFLERARRLIRDVESGRYNRKQTIGEMIRAEVARRGLTSCMNNTKWREFQNAMEKEMPFPPPYLYKTLFEEDGPELDLSRDGRDIGFYDQESFAGFDFRILQWVKVRPRYLEYSGGALTGTVILHEAEDELVEILNRYHIPWERENGTYLIYGYR